MDEHNQIKPRAAAIPPTKRKGEKQMKKALRAIKEVVLFVLGYDCDTRRQAVNEGLIDLSGQGRGKYGS